MTFVFIWYRSNDVWLLNLKSWIWSKQKIQGAKPKPRYGHSQIVLDEDHILIIGECYNMSTWTTIEILPQSVVYRAS